MSHIPYHPPKTKVTMSSMLKKIHQNLGRRCNYFLLKHRDWKKCRLILIWMRPVAQQIGGSWILPPQQESSASIERCLDDEILTTEKFAQILHATWGKNWGQQRWLALWSENEVKKDISHFCYVGIEMISNKKEDILYCWFGFDFAGRLFWDHSSEFLVTDLIRNGLAGVISAVSIG